MKQIALKASSHFLAQLSLAPSQIVKKKYYCSFWI
jgi:hypothetical protein